MLLIPPFQTPIYEISCLFSFICFANTLLPYSFVFHFPLFSIPSFQTKEKGGWSATAADQLDANHPPTPLIICNPELPWL